MCDGTKNIVGFVPGVCARCKQKHDCNFGIGLYCSRSCATNNKPRMQTYKSDDSTHRVCSRKDCEKNGELQSIENFYKRSVDSGRRSHCKYCQLKMVRNHQTTLKGFVKNVFNGINRRCKLSGRQNDIDINFLHELFDKQKGLCAISGMIMTHINNTEETTRSPFNMSLDRKIVL